MTTDAIPNHYQQAYDTSVLAPQLPTAKGKRKATAFSLYLVAGILLSLVFLVPLAWAILQSFDSPGVISAAPSAKNFTNLTFANYISVFSGQNGIFQNVINSLVVAIATALLTAILSTLAGYGFGLFRFRGSGLAFSLILLTLMIPFQALLTPLFLELNSMHLTNNLLGLILFYTTFNLPFGVYVMRNTFKSIPTELLDSANVDGASTLTVLTRVLRPLVVPGIATTVLYAFLFAWTEFLGALTFLTSDKLFTLPVALLNIETGTFGQVNYGALLAGSVVSMIPCIVLYIALQKYYVKGLTSGAIR